MSRPTPPGLARRLLEWALPDDRCDDIVGDLDEVYQSRFEERGSIRARAWYVRQALAFGVRFALQRVHERPRITYGALGLDMAMAFRRLRARPVSSAVVVLTLALGLGANAAMFQIVEALRLRTLPVAEPERWTIVEIADMSHWHGRRTSGYPVLSYALWERIREGDGPFDATLAWANTSFFLEDSGAPTVVRGLFVSGAFFEVLGVAPAVGRTFGATDDRPGCSLEGVVLGHGYWQRAFGGDPSVVGRTIILDGHPAQVVGVAAAGFGGLEVGRVFDVAVPVCAQALLGGGEQWIDDRMVFWLTVMGRVPPNESLSAVNAQLDARSPALFAATVPDRYSADETDDFSSLRLRATLGAFGVSGLRTRYGDAFVALLVVTGLVLLIVCTNLANLFLARGAVRQRELALRQALGASRGRLLRELTIESIVLAAAGAAAGLALAGTLSSRLVDLIGPDPSLDLSLGAPTIAFVIAAAGLSTLVFGLLPAWRTAWGRGNRGLHGLRAGRGAAVEVQGAGLRRWLVVSQVALSFVLVFGALLFTSTVRNLLSIDTGYDSGGVMVARVDFRSLDLSGASRRTFKRDLLERMREVPGVASADEVRHVPLGGTGSSAEARTDDGTSVPIRLNGVTNQYAETAGLDLLAGRGFEPGDDPDARLAVVTESFATRVGLGPNPVGRSVRIDTGEIGSSSGTEFEVIGLVADAKYFNLREEPVPTLLLPKSLLLDPRSYADFMIRTSLRPDRLRDALRTSVADGRPLVWTEVRPFDDTIQAGLVRERLLSTVSGFFGGLAALVAAIGLYGVMTQQVTRRRSEIGVRLALGARRRHVLLLVVGQAGALVATGIVIGALLALAASTTVRSFLFGLDTRMAALLAIAAAVLCTTGALACYLPARRATAMDPQAALRLD